jgi:uncharacterized protein YndB with AHSA1/START domain
MVDFFIKLAVNIQQKMTALSHRLLIAAKPEKVYNAINDPQALSKWWTPKIEISGGNIKFHFGESYFKEMKIVSQKTDTQVAWECLAGADEWIGTTITFELNDFNLKYHPEMTGQWEQLCGKIDVTLLTFRHDGWNNLSPMFAECNYTWALFLRSLKLHCETGKGTPWPNQHIM